MNFNDNDSLTSTQETFHKKIMEAFISEFLANQRNVEYYMQNDIYQLHYTVLSVENENLLNTLRDHTNSDSNGKTNNPRSWYVFKSSRKSSRISMFVNNVYSKCD